MRTLSAALPLAATGLVAILATALLPAPLAHAQDDASKTPPATATNSQVDAANGAERETRALRVTVPRSGHGSVSTDELREMTDQAREGVAKRWEKLLREGAHPAGPPIHVTPIDPNQMRALNPPIQVDPSKGFGDFTLFQTTPLNGVVSNTFRSIVNEPSLAAAGDRVFFSWNWWAADSDDQGASFSGINPFSGPFAAPASNPFCCDQVVVHDPANNSLFLLQQYVENGTTGVQRINVDQGTDGTFDCSYDITPQGFGFGAGDWPDFPDMAVGSTFLYHSSNVFDSFFEGSFVARYPLSELAACDAILNSEVYTNTNYGSFRLTQGASDTMWFADHFSTSILRIWNWPDADASPGAISRSVTPWANSARTCAGPDGRDWCGFIDSRILGGFVQDDQVGFLWTPSQDGNHAFPYTRIARFAQSDSSLTSEADFYSNDFAIVYASAAPNERGHVGGVAMFGGGTTYYPSCLAWIVDDVTGAPDFTNIETQAVSLGTSGPSTNRSGDYLSVRSHSTYPETWVASCFSLPATGNSTPVFVWFGRERSDPPTSIHWDGFESNNLMYWDSFAP